MAERWQQWMPFHIDRWRGSAHVQAMSGEARAGYLYLLAAAWQTDDCALPGEVEELQVLSGLTEVEWERSSARILRRFQKTPDGRLRNLVLFDEWNDAHSMYERNHLAKVKAGKKGAAKRWDSKLIAQPLQSHDSAIANDGNSNPTGTTTRTSTKNKQNPSAEAAETKPDPRHEGCKAAVMEYGAYKRVSLAWDGSEGKALAAILKAAPQLTVREFQECLTNRARSPGTPHGERPRIWLPHILRYQQGPLNEFNRTEEVNNGKLGNRKADAASAALTRSIARVVEEDRAASEAGDDVLGPGGSDGRNPPGLILNRAHGGVPG